MEESTKLVRTKIEYEEHSEMFTESTQLQEKDDEIGGRYRDLVKKHTEIFEGFNLDIDHMEQELQKQNETLLEDLRTNLRSQWMQSKEYLEKLNGEISKMSEIEGHVSKMHKIFSQFHTTSRRAFSHAALNPGGMSGDQLYKDVHNEGCPSISKDAAAPQSHVVHGVAGQKRNLDVKQQAKEDQGEENSKYFTTPVKSSGQRGTNW